MRRVHLSYLCYFLLLLAGLFSTITFAVEIGCPGPFCEAPDTSTRILSGYAWSSNIGWISFSNNGSEGPPYRVYLLEPEAGSAFRYFGGLDGEPGYAWSPSIGWIKFDEHITENLDSGDIFPSSGKAADIYGVRIDTGYQFVSGWVRACVVFVSGCSGPLETSDKRGGWDGWIKFSGTTDSGSTYQVKLNEGQNPAAFYHSGDPAWGGSVLGWVSFCSPGSSPISYCVRLDGLSASCQVFGEPGDIAKDANGIIDISDGGQVRWSGNVVNGQSPFWYSWSWSDSAGSSGVAESKPEGTEETTFDTFSTPIPDTQTYSCPEDPVISTEQADFSAFDSNGVFKQCHAQATVRCSPLPTCGGLGQPICGGGGAGGFLTAPTPAIIRINSQPLASPAISSETTFRNTFSSGSNPLEVAIKSSKSLVPGSTVSLADLSNTVKCRLETSAVSDPSDPEDKGFITCGIGRGLDLAPSSGAIAHFNIRVSSSTPLLNQNSPYEIIVGSSTCPLHPSITEACYDVVRSFIFDYAASTINEL